MDGVFLAVTLMNGAVKLIKMPPVLNPLEGDTKSSDGPPVASSHSQSKPPPTSGKGAAERQSQDVSSMQSLANSGEGEQTILLKNDIEKFGYEELDLSKHLVTTIAAKKKSDFVDPFAVDEEDKSAAQDDTPPPETSISQAKKPDLKNKNAKDIS